MTLLKLSESALVQPLANFDRGVGVAAWISGVASRLVVRQVKL